MGWVGRRRVGTPGVSARADSRHRHDPGCHRQGSSLSRRRHHQTWSRVDFELDSLFWGRLDDLMSGWILSRC